MTSADLERPPPFVLPSLGSAAASRRLHSIGADGRGEHAEDNPWVHMQLQDPFAAAAESPATATGSGGGDDAAAGSVEDLQQQQQTRPEDVIKAFSAAKGELEWLQAALTTLREGRYLTVGRVERPKGPQRLADLAAAANSRYRRRAAAAAAAAAALSEGAAALSVLAAREDSFYVQVSQLQRYWKVVCEPAESAYAYSIDLRLLPGNSNSDGSGGVNLSSSLASGAIGAAAAPAVVASGDIVRVMKDPGGALRVQVTPAVDRTTPPSIERKAESVTPTVFRGPAAIHSLLLRQLRTRAWQAVLSSLDADVAALLHLPARLRPSAAAAATGAAATGAAATGAAATGAAATGAAATGAAATGAGEADQFVVAGGGRSAAAAAAAGAAAAGAAAAAAAPPTGGSSGRPLSSGSGSGGGSRTSSIGGSSVAHVTFYSMLARLVLQAVEGTAGTAGEAAAAAAAAVPPLVSPPGVGPEAGTQSVMPPPHDSGAALALSDALSLADVDVGAPWDAAAAAAAAILGDGGGGSHGSGLIAQYRSSTSSGGSSGAGAAAAAAAVAAVVSHAPSNCGLADRRPSLQTNSNPALSCYDSVSNTIVVDPFLLSLRPLVLMHVLLTRMGHLLTVPHSAYNAAGIAAAAYSAAARATAERARSRVAYAVTAGGGGSGGGGSGGGSGGGGSGGAAAAAGAVAAQRRGSVSSSRAAAAAAAEAGAGAAAAISGSGSGNAPAAAGAPAGALLAALSRWIAHAACRELLRTALDRELLRTTTPGAVVAHTLPCCRSCTSALLLLPAPASRRWRGRTEAGPNQCAVTVQAAQSPLLVLLNDTTTLLEGGPLAAPWQQLMLTTPQPLLQPQHRHQEGQQQQQQQPGAAAVVGCEGAAAAAAAAGAGGRANSSRGDRRILAAAAAAAAAIAPETLVGAAGVGSGVSAGRCLRARDVQLAVSSPASLPALLAPLLDALSADALVS